MERNQNSNPKNNSPRPSSASTSRPSSASTSRPSSASTSRPSSASTSRPSSTPTSSYSNRASSTSTSASSSASSGTRFGGKRTLKHTSNQGAYIEQSTGDEYYTVGDVVGNVGTSIGYALIYMVMVIGISVILACVGWIVANDVLALNKIPHTAVIDVTEWDDFDSVANKLKEEGIIDYKIAFDLFGMVTSSKEKISPGTYTVDTDMDYNALIRNLGKDSSTRAEVSITIPEGYTVEQIFQLLEDKGVASVTELVEKAANYNYKFEFLQDIPLGDYHRLEGFLFPDTYTFYVYHDPLYVINTMLANFYYRVIANDTLMDSIENSGYTLREILNVAAMIERETDGTDQKNISSVIFNRLENPSYETNGCLQIDATIYYLTGREVTQEDRETIQNPYNTHINSGLPPGAICNPGLSSIQAAANPENTKYYYYALGDDNLHHFYQSYSGLLNFINTQNRYN